MPHNSYYQDTSYDILNQYQLPININTSYPFKTTLIMHFSVFTKRQWA